MRDPAFLADAEKRRLLIDFMPAKKSRNSFKPSKAAKEVAERAKAMLDE